MSSPAQSKPSYPQLEREVLRFWQEHDVFAESIRARAGAPRFRFYEGPPTANGRPHVAHMLPRVYKDIFPRYRTMTGHLVLRQAGWDTHGLPVELEVEKELGISGKPAIEAYGIERFNAKCRESVWRYLTEWEQAGTVRLGYWLDLPGAYITYTNDYIESVWWALRQLWDRGLLYRGHKVVPYCPRCGTSLSSHEVAQGYAEADDPSVFVRFGLDELRGRPVTAPTWLLVWTTTPWTLPSNAAVAVNPAETYVLVELTLPGAGEQLVMARGALDNVFGAPAAGAEPHRPYRVLAEFAGRELAGTPYRPPFRFVPEPAPAPSPGPSRRAWTVLEADFVRLDEGTGIVHLAPAFGEDDYQMGRRYDLPFFQPIDTAGRFTGLVPDWQGQFVKDADAGIVADLQQRGLLFRSGRYQHTYPFCWRCDAPLLYYARESWFIRTTAHQERMIELNRQINWLPGHLREGRFGNFLDHLVDWNLSRERYWGSPLPVWICRAEGCGHQHCVGSFAELAAMATGPLADPFDPHRPFIDQVFLRCSSCGGEMARVPYVIDCWFESGCMPFAQYHYPFRHQELFWSTFPADYIAEAIDQTRGWFYSLHAIATMLFDRPAYLNCICTEHGLDAQGYKMSKSRGNVLGPEVFYDRQGADALRWFLVAGSPAWTSKRFDHDGVTAVQNQVLDTLYHAFSFFNLYAGIDGFRPGAPETAAARPDPSARPALDRWLLSRLEALVAECRTRMDGFDATGATRLMAEFIDDLSNWYVRRGRRRYWKAEDDQDKSSAHWTLFEALRTLAKLMAPVVPFITEHIYQALRLPDEPLSVHLATYPEPGLAQRDLDLETAMATCRRLVGLGRAARNRSGIRTRQPLPEIVVSGARLDPDTEAQLLEELNVKSVRYDDQAGDYVSYQAKLNFERAGKRLGRLVPPVARALGELDPAMVAARVAAGAGVTVAAGEEQVALEAADIIIRTQERGGFAVEREGPLQVAISTQVSEELLWEGLAREVTNRIQRARKEAGLRVTDRIAVRLAAQGALAQALAVHRAHIAREVLADQLTVTGPPLAPAGAEQEVEGGAYRAELDIEGDRLGVVLWLDDRRRQG